MWVEVDIINAPINMKFEVIWHNYRPTDVRFVLFYIINTPINMRFEVILHN